MLDLSTVKTPFFPFQRENQEMERQSLWPVICNLIIVTKSILWQKDKAQASFCTG